MYPTDGAHNHTYPPPHIVAYLDAPSIDVHKPQHYYIDNSKYKYRKLDFP